MKTNTRNARNTKGNTKRNTKEKTKKNRPTQQELQVYCRESANTFNQFEH